MSADNGQIDDVAGAPTHGTHVPFRISDRPTAAPSPAVPPDDGARECIIVIGNHASYVGIGEILYTLVTYFSARYRTRVAGSLVPDQINVVIDEFAIRARVDLIRQMKVAHPKTQFILMATEFVTPIRLLGVSLGETFNFFALREDYRHLLHLLAHRVRLTEQPPYMYARYRGFIEMLGTADVVLCAHPGIANTMQLLPGDLGNPTAPWLTLYPEIDLDRLARDQRLFRLPAGVVMTGTLTTFRERVVSRMLNAFRKAGVSTAFYQHVRFDQSRALRINDQEPDFGYEEIDIEDQAGSQAADGVRNFLYNLNPPQRANWPYSSPMRILRAIMLGQIPVVTRKFEDHDIETTAVLWDGKVNTAERMWAEATMGRAALVERYLASVADYNRVAQEKNAAIDRALASLE